MVGPKAFLFGVSVEIFQEKKRCKVIDTLCVHLYFLLGLDLNFTLRSSNVFKHQISTGRKLIR